jgi:hypothetical protein
MVPVPVAKLKAAAVESGYANLEISSAAGGFWFFSVPDHLAACPSGSAGDCLPQQQEEAGVRQ